MLRFSTPRILACLVLLLLGGMNVLAQREPVPTDPDAREKPVVDAGTSKSVVNKRIREGTTFTGKRVFFRQTGNRTTLYTVEDNDRYLCLENLNLERILKAMEEKSDRNVWKIDGTFTEFRGENFVLITRAVVAPENFMPSDPVVGPKPEKTTP